MVGLVSVNKNNQRNSSSAEAAVHCTADHLPPFFGGEVFWSDLLSTRLLLALSSPFSFGHENVPISFSYKGFIFV